MSEVWTGIVSVAFAIIALAAFATAVSNKAQTGQVITSAGNSLATNVLAAVSPVTGNTPTISNNISYGSGI